MGIVACDVHELHLQTDQTNLSNIHARYPSIVGLLRRDAPSSYQRTKQCHPRCPAGCLPSFLQRPLHLSEVMNFKSKTRRQTSDRPNRTIPTLNDVTRLKMSQEDSRFVDLGLESAPKSWGVGGKTDVGGTWQNRETTLHALHSPFHSNLHHPSPSPSPHQRHWYYPSTAVSTTGLLPAVN